MTYPWAKFGNSHKVVEVELHKGGISFALDHRCQPISDGVALLPPAGSWRDCG